MNIEKIQKETGASIIIFADENGNVIDSSNTEYTTNFAKMSNTAFSMCTDLLKEMTGSSLNQLIARSNENYFIVNKLDSNSMIILTSDNLSRFGFLLKYMSTIENK